MKTFSKIALVAAAVGFAVQANADTNNIVFYSFTSNTTFAVTTPAWTNASVTADIGSSISSFGKFNTAGTPLTFLSSVSGNPNNRGFLASNSVSQNNWDGSGYFQFSLDSTGYQGMYLSWGMNRSSTGPTGWDIKYSTTGVGGPFLTFGSVAAGNNVLVTVDMSAVGAIDNNANVIFRLVGTGASNTAAGTAKIDNFAIDATVIPEPSTMLLVGMGLVGLMALRRRRS
jgi:hypothetical protein